MFLLTHFYYTTVLTVIHVFQLWSVIHNHPQPFTEYCSFYFPIFPFEYNHMWQSKIWTLCSGLLNVLFACHFSMRLHTRLFISLARVQISNSWTLEENWDRNGSLSLTHFLIPVFGQIIPPLIDLNQNRSKLKLYIGHLTALCHERDPHILQDLAPPSAYHRSQQDAWEEELQKMSPEQVRLGDINMGILFSLKYFTFYCMYPLIMVTYLVFLYSQMCFSHYEKVNNLQWRSMH